MNISHLTAYHQIHAAAARLATAAVVTATLLAGSHLAVEEARSDPATDEVAQLLGQVNDLLDAGQVDSAFAVVVPYLAQGPVDSRVARAVVTTSEMAGAPRRGTRAIEAMIRLRPNEVQLHVGLGQIELGRDRPEVALRHFQRAVLIDQHLPEALGGFGRSRGRLDTEIEPALAYLDKLAQAKPSVASIRYGKAVLLHEAKRAEEARGEFRWAIGLEDENWLYRRDYAQLLLDLGERESAIEHLEKALELLKKGGDPVTARRLSAEITAAREGGSE
jgi:tetratricopeptide (TPR) repeat protein